MRKKYSVTVDQGRVVLIEIDGKAYKDPQQIPDPDDQRFIDMIVADLDFLTPGESEREQRPGKIVLGVFTGVAVLMLAIFLVSAVIIGRNIAGEVTAPGRVVSLVNRSDSSGATYSYPVVQFTLPDNSEQTLTLAEGSWPPAYVIGQPVTVRYDPNRLPEVHIQNPGSLIARWTLPIIMAVLAAAFTGAVFFARWILKS